VQAMPPDLCTASRYVACHAVPREAALFAALNDAMPKHVSLTITINHQLTKACFASNATNMLLLLLPLYNCCDGVWGWRWHHLDHMQTICTSLQTDNHTNTSSFNFYRPDALPDAQLTVPKH